MLHIEVVISIISYIPNVQGNEKRNKENRRISKPKVQNNKMKQWL